MPATSVTPSSEPTSATVADAATAVTTATVAEAEALAEAGFADWLTVQRLPRARRRQVEAVVERFLTWRSTAPFDHVADLHIATWCYLEQRRRDGAGAAELHTEWAALELLVDYTGSTAEPGHLTEVC